MKNPAQALVLASSSKYRRQLLARLVPDFECFSPAVDETPRPDESPAALALRLAQAKAMVGSEQFPQALIIGSDQVPALGEAILHKPGSHERALDQLRLCSGKSVIFHTAVVMITPEDNQVTSHVDQTIVRFRELSDREISAYLDYDQPYDCAGSFKVESRGVVLFEAIESTDPTALQGLPLIWVAGQLRQQGML